MVSKERIIILRDLLALSQSCIPSLAKRVATSLFASVAILFPFSPATANSVVIWPINPVIKAQEKAAALWLENAGETEITLQVQSFAWSQQDGQDVFALQQEVMATPALVTLPPKAKQLIRLTRLAPPPQEPERAYRLIIDEVPRAALARKAADDGTPSGQGAAVNFRMRYSLPLFSYAPNIQPEKLDGGPQLAWRIVTNQTVPKIEIRNQGQRHARLTSAKISSGGQSWDISGGLLGYVLPGRSMAFPLPDKMTASAAQSATLSLSVNGAEAAALSKIPPSQSPQ